MKKPPVHDIKQHYSAVSFSISRKIKSVIFPNNLYIFEDKNMQRHSSNYLKILCHSYLETWKVKNIKFCFAI